MKKILICGIKAIEHRAQKPWKPRTSLISIGDANSTPPNLLFKPGNILRLEFDDVTFRQISGEFCMPNSIKETEEKQIEFLKNNGVIIFKSEQAKQIAEFVYKNYDITDTLICQCHYGQSRSAGCAAAISQHFFRNGIDIFSDERYLPNKLVYNKVLLALKAAENQRSV